MKQQIKKSFANDKTGKEYKTLKAAIEECKAFESIFRTWSVDGEIIGMYEVYTTGERVCRIDWADQEIKKRLKEMPADEICRYSRMGIEIST